MIREFVCPSMLNTKWEVSILNQSGYLIQESEPRRNSVLNASLTSILWIDQADHGAFFSCMKLLS